MEVGKHLSVLSHEWDGKEVELQEVPKVNLLV